jgi:hypothetical protein
MDRELPNTDATMAAGTIYVIATNETGMRRALETARRRARHQAASIVVLVPHVVPCGIDLFRCGCDLTQVAEPYRVVALGGGVPATVRVRLSRGAAHVQADAH